MNKPLCAQIAIAINGESGGIRISGRANATCSVAFRDVMEHLREHGARKIFLYLRQCLLMDSTFLGVLAQQGGETYHAGRKDGLSIFLVSPSERVRNMIENLGILDEFQLVPTEPDLAFDFHVVNPTPDCDLREYTRTSLEAHQTLIDLNHDNLSRFKEVTSLLSRDLKKYSATKEQSS